MRTKIFYAIVLFPFLIFAQSNEQLKNLGIEFWKWRTVQQPVSSDDIPRIDRPDGWKPGWREGLRWALVAAALLLGLYVVFRFFAERAALSKDWIVIGQGCLGDIPLRILPLILIAILHVIFLVMGIGSHAFKIE